MSSNRPLWLRAVHRLERTVGTPIESAVRSDTYFDIVAMVTRASSKTRRTAEGASRRALHLFNLPAGSDMRRVREQLSRVERRLNELTEEIAERDGGGPAPRD
jgi:hypothetical protein